MCSFLNLAQGLSTIALAIGNQVNYLAMRAPFSGLARIASRAVRTCSFQKCDIRRTTCQRMTKRPLRRSFPCRWIPLLPSA